MPIISVRDLVELIPFIILIHLSVCIEFTKSDDFYTHSQILVFIELTSFNADCKPFLSIFYDFCSRKFLVKNGLINYNIYN